MGKIVGFEIGDHSVVRLDDKDITVSSWYILPVMN